MPRRPHIRGEEAMTYMKNTRKDCRPFIKIVPILSLCLQHFVHKSPNKIRRNACCCYCCLIVHNSDIHNRALTGYPGTRPKDPQNRVPGYKRCTRVPVKFQTPNSIPLFRDFT